MARYQDIIAEAKEWGVEVHTNDYGYIQFMVGGEVKSWVVNNGHNQWLAFDHSGHDFIGSKGKAASWALDAAVNGE